MADMLDLFKVGALLFSKDPLRTFQAVDQMREKRQNKSAIDSLFAPMQQAQQTGGLSALRAAAPNSIPLPQLSSTMAGLPQGISPQMGEVLQNPTIMQMVEKLPQFKQQLGAAVLGDMMPKAPLPPVKLGANEVYFDPNTKTEIFANRIEARPDLTELAKLKADFDAGRIDKPTYDEAVMKMNYITPREAPETWKQLSADEASAKGLPKGGTYEVSSRGQTRAVLARQGNPFERADYWRAQVKPFADAATNARVQSSKVKSSLGLGTGTGHIAAINALQKMIDEGAVVRDQDVALIQSAQSFASRLESQMEGLRSGKILSQELQNELQGVAASIEQAVYQGVNERVSAYEPVMKAEGVGMDTVLPPNMRKMFAPKEDDGARGGETGQSESLGGSPSAGTVEDGYRFKGGDPADKNNWEKVQ